MKIIASYITFLSVVFSMQSCNSQVVKPAAFEYKEVYFSPNFDKSNQQLNNTNDLELEWALWGHNIVKWVKKEKTTDSIYAFNEGFRETDQLCFSSVELKKIIKKNIKRLQVSDKNLTRFTIAPYDSDIACQCNLCKTKGNTKTNASPAVFSLIAELAKEYPKLTFWSLGYVSTKTPPTFKMPDNVGVLLSTIDCQEGLPLEQTKKGNQFINEIATWKSKINKIYIWDYVVNFDNFMDPYPIFSATQKNAELYLNKGVSGIFLQGSGYDYSILEEVKYQVLAKIVSNPQGSIDDFIKEAAIKYYPTLSSAIADFLAEIDLRCSKTNKKQGIYSSVKEATKRYLSYDLEENLLLKTLKVPETTNIIKLKISLLYLELETLRVSALSPNNFAAKKDNTLQIVDVISDKLKLLKELHKKSDLKVINEKNETFENYFNQWTSLFNRLKTNNTFFNLNLKTTSILDEDYKDLAILNDGLFGFENYNDNWLLYSGKELVISMNGTDFSSQMYNKVEIGLLEDKKHKIALPSEIEIWSGNELIQKYKTPLSTNNNPNVKVIQLMIKKSENTTIRFVNSNKTIAIDEIRFSHE